MRAIDLFCGCGGLSLGLETAGIKVVAAFDKWLPALRVYQLNFDHPAQELDLSVEAPIDLFKRYAPDIIVGGPPCQDFSSAGLRDENGGRADLTLNFAQIVSTVRPEWFVMENVDRILKSQRVLQEAIALYKQAGYGLTAKVLDASYCGVPQNRKRYFLIGRLGEDDNFLHSRLEAGLAKNPMTLREYFGDELGLEAYYRHPRSYARRGVFSVDEPSPTIRGVNRPIPPGYKSHPGDVVDSTKGIRPLSTQERARIQTFPADFKFVGPASTVEQMLGNAVPVGLATYVGQCIVAYANTHQQTNPVPLRQRNGQMVLELREEKAAYVTS